MTKPPTWTPPIDGWQYRIEWSRGASRYRVLARGFVLFSWGSGWIGQTRPRTLSQRSAAAKGSLNYCCAVLDAALKARK